MRKCDLSQVPTKKNDTRIIYDWQNAIGLIIPFEYDGINDEFEIINYESRDKVYVKYNNKIHMVYGKYIRKGRIAKIFDQEIEWKYHVGENIKDNPNSHKRDITITKRYYSKDNPSFKVAGRNYKWYQYKCNICGYDCEMDNFWVNEADLKDGKGCGCCAGTKVVKGVNDIATTAPEYLQYIVDKDFAYTHTKTSNKKVLVKCPICGYEKEMPFVNLYFQSFGCPNCSDGFSYPEKFIKIILDQNNIQYKQQLNKSDFQWCGKYKYDFYLSDFNCIIETHGRQHYEESGWTNLKLQQKIDKKKKELAIQNGIENYIELDCRESSIDYMKKSIESSYLNSILKDIDYEWADLFSQKSLLKEVCKYYNSNSTKQIEIAKVFNISYGCVNRYIRKGRELGIINDQKKRRK